VVPTVDATPDLVVELAGSDAGTGFVGAVVGIEKGNVALEDRHGKRRWFPLGGGFLVDGELVVLAAPAQAPPAQAAPTRPARTASGSISAPPQRARVARASRILVEGRHDAELVEKVWGDDLRVEGVVVEQLGGIDDLPAVVREFAPSRDRRLGVLVDHLVAGSKESRLAAQVVSPHLRVVGHPYVDVWQAVRPGALGIAAWPEVPRGTPWKEGVCAGLGWPVDPPAAWRRILGAVRSYADLEPSLLGRVEELIDFVTHGDTGP
jgi:hypothetical protein